MNDGIKFEILLPTHSPNCTSPDKETGHICCKCGKLYPICRISRFDLPSAEGTGCDNCYPRSKKE